MKKTIFITLFLCCAFALFAADKDVIITTKAERIEALITEVAPDAIRYHKFDNPTGPIFVIYTKDVSAVIYKNGEIQTFTQKQSASTTTEIKNEPVLVTTTPATTEVKRSKSNFSKQVSDDALGYIYRDDGEFVFQGRYITNKEYVKILKNHCPEAYEQYKKANNCVIAGAVLAGIGGGMALGSLLALGTPDFALTCACISIAPLVASIPLLVIGVQKERKSIDVFNERCASQMALNFQVSQNGVGLALNF